MKSLSTKSISSALAAAFFAIAAAALLIAGSVQITIHANASSKTVSANQALLAQGAAKSVATFIEQKFSIMETALSIEDWSQATPMKCLGFLESMLGRDKSFRNLAYLDATSNRIAAASRQSQVLSATFLRQLDRDRVSHFKQARRYISPVSIDPETYEPLITLSVWSTDLLGDFTGILTVEVNLKFIWNLVDRLQIGETGQSYVVDGNGDLLAAKDISRVIRGENLARVSKVAEFIHQTSSDHAIEVSIFTGIDGSKVVGTAVGLGVPDWALVTELPLKEAYRDVINSVLISVAALLAIALASAWVGILMARRLADPLINLASIASRITEGETKLHAPVKGPREVSTLADSFNKMTRQLITMLSTEEARARKLALEIEERKKTQAALNESDSVLRATLESTEDGLLVVDNNGKVTHYNSRFRDIWSIPEEILATRDDSQLIQTVLSQLVDPKQFVAATDKLYQSSETSRDIHIFKDGRIIDRFSAPLIRNGRATGRVWFFRDVTERKRIEESLRITQFSVDHAAMGIYRITSDAKIVEVNQKAGDLLGYDRRELAALTVLDINPSLNEEGWKRVWRKMKDGGSNRFEATHLRKDGTPIPVEIFANFMEYGGHEYAITFVQDISERKRNEEELRQLRNYLSNVINSMPSALVGVDADGRITQWNQTVAASTGITADAAQGKALTDLMPWMSSEMTNISKSIRTRQTILDAKKQRLLEDGTCYEDVTIYPLVSNGVEGAVIRIDDVTERVRMEEMMIQSEKMLSVGGLAAGMAHEINNPLAGMIQTARVMANRLEKNSTIEANRKAAAEAGISMEAIGDFMEKRGILQMVETIVDSGQRVASIVSNMLSFARKSEARISTYSLVDLLDKTLGLASTDYDLRKQYDFKLIDVVKEYAEDLPSVPCEGAKIQQVLLNLLRNGAQAMQAAGTENPRIIIRAYVERQTQMACLEIEDNGPGMEEATRKRVFEPFFTTKPVGVGTGLGLSVSYFIITENHKGQMRVESSPGKGTTFFIRLPLRGVES